MNVIGSGSGIVECLRIAQMIERHADLFLTRVFTAREIEFCNSRKASTQHFASHWAGKEAVLTALGGGRSAGIRWIDIEIRNHPQTHVALGGAMRRACEKLGVGSLVVSISHCRTHATGHALALGPEDELTLE